MSGNSAYAVAMEQLDQVAARMKLPAAVVDQLREPERSLTVRIPVRMDSGDVRTFTGYRVHHNSALGPTKGGTRVHPDEKYEDVLALSFWMTIKNALAGIPAGGAKGGIVADPLTLSQGEMERLCRAYMRAIMPLVDSKLDIPGPDIGTPQEVMAWFLDEYEQCRGRHEPSVIAGKPPVLGGSLGRDRATAYGVACVLQQALAERGASLQGLRVAIQGFGNLGGNLALILSQRGATVIAISDVTGGWFKAEGLDVEEAFRYAHENKTLRGWGGGQPLSNGEVLTLDCDALIPAAIQSQITEAKVGEVRARLIVEGANGPTTPEAEQYLLAHGVFLVPDIVANVGGAVVSYFEMVQDLYMHFWTEEQVISQLEQHMVQVFRQVYGVAQQEGVSLRLAAWMLALNKVVSAMRLRGRV